LAGGLAAVGALEAAPLGGLEAAQDAAELGRAHQRGDALLGLLDLLLLGVGVLGDEVARAAVGADAVDRAGAEDAGPVALLAPGFDDGLAEVLGRGGVAGAEDDE